MQTRGRTIITIIPRPTALLRAPSHTPRPVASRRSRPQLSLSLFHKVVPDECSYSVGTAKVEIKLKKQIPGKWESLEGSGEEAVQTMNAPPPPASSTAVADPDAAPSSKVYSGSSKNWNAI